MKRADLWLVAYGLLGLTQNGLLPVLLPLVAPSGSSAGITYAVFSLFGLAAPVLGTWADRSGRHRDLLIWGTVGAGVLLLLFDTAGVTLRIAIAAGAGLGTMAATAAGNVLAIQGTQETEWEGRVARLQRFISAGQVLGLSAAGIVAHARPGEGFVLAGAALIAAGVLGIAAPVRLPRDPRHKPDAGPIVGGDVAAAAAHRGHRAGWAEISAYLKVINRPLRRFLIVWLVGYSMMNGFATMFPVAMIHQFGMDPILPSGAYAIGVGLSLLVYTPVGVVTHRVGGGRMLIVGLAARLALVVTMVALDLCHMSWTGVSILVGFGLIQFVWPILGVAANALSVRLAPQARGESAGLFYAAMSLAASVGSALAGVVLASAGFGALAGATAIAICAALALAVLWLPGGAKHPM
jgi:MFS family permease